MCESGHLDPEAIRINGGNGIISAAQRRPRHCTSLSYAPAAADVSENGKHPGAQGGA
jgi:hypothetical protein